MFKDEGLDITIVANLKAMNFLDVEVDLNTGTHRPFTKPNNTLLYIDVNWNHPPSALKNTVQAVQNRLSMLSSNKEIFEQAAPPYQKAPDSAGYKHKLEFTEPTSNKVKYIDLFGSLTEQKDVAEMFAILLKIRKRLLGDVLESACEGNNTRPVG